MDGEQHRLQVDVDLDILLHLQQDGGAEGLVLVQLKHRVISVGNVILVAGPMKRLVDGEEELALVLPVLLQSYSHLSLLNVIIWMFHL
jgi:hypothetical protein